jgi:ATP-dependent RNA helicase DDX19/DBP5
MSDDTSTISALVEQIGGLLNSAKNSGGFSPTDKAGEPIIGSEGKNDNQVNVRAPEITTNLEDIDRAAVQLGQDVSPVKSWDELNLKPEIRRALVEVGFVKPSVIQETALPLIITHKRNLIAQAKNGSGKTACFTLGLLSVVDRGNPKTQAMVLSPTRELAKQNLDVIGQLGRFCGLTAQLVVPMAEGLADAANAQILSGTPGKVLELLRKRVINGKGVCMFVLDEADVMISPENNMGVQVSNIRSLLNSNVQTLLFSATYPESVRRFAHQIVPKAAKIEVKTTDLTLSTIWQVWMESSAEISKFKILSDLYAIMNVGQSIIFVNSRNTAFDLAKKMKDDGHSVSLICGSSKSANGQETVDPKQRDQVLDEFRSGVSKVLIATDVLARGIDVPAVTLVINYELPINYEGPDRKGVNFETYLHRIGRTGRFGQKGVAVNLVTTEENEKITKIEQFYNCHIEKLEADIDMLETRLKEIGEMNKTLRANANV